MYMSRNIDMHILFCKLCSYLIYNIYNIYYVYVIYIYIYILYIIYIYMSQSDLIILEAYVNHFTFYNIYSSSNCKTFHAHTQW